MNFHSIWRQAILSIILLLTKRVSAGFTFTSPSTGDSYAAGASFDIEWTSSDASPEDSNIDTVTFTLMSGPSDDLSAFATLGSAIPFTSIVSNKYTVSVPATSGADGTYFIQIYCTLNDGATAYYQVYSPKFTMTGMTGTLEPSGADSSLPYEVYYDPAASAAATSNAVESFSVTYTAQTGTLRYAPLQELPGTTLTASLTVIPQYPTSSVSYFSTITNKPSQLSTLSMSTTYYSTWAINTRAAAEGPDSNGGFYTAKKRWLDEL